MSYTVVMILVVAMCIGMIVLAVGYLNKGYSYKHTIDELPDETVKETEQDKT